MERKEIEKHILRIFHDEFEIENPENDIDLREAYGFDSIDAIELLAEIEVFLGFELTLDEKKQAMEISTLGQIYDYVENLSNSRA
ncbi:MAG: acyl carrier protein [Deltaproteobacteria bacterium]|nr:acyl carrier protein [Deltaproteobacteria bacterium]MBW1983722.1 acyl carrier protein [Deltaproteobacteria bacterium]MBW2364873.1 acyl carrier protein [Deltaproteobacteria bacterium]